MPWRQRPQEEWSFAYSSGLNACGSVHVLRAQHLVRYGVQPTGNIVRGRYRPEKYASVTDMPTDKLKVSPYDPDRQCTWLASVLFVLILIENFIPSRRRHHSYVPGCCIVSCSAQFQFLEWRSNWSEYPPTRATEENGIPKYTFRFRWHMFDVQWMPPDAPPFVEHFFPSLLPRKTLCLIKKLLLVSRFSDVPYPAAAGAARTGVEKLPCRNSSRLIH